MSIVKMKSKSGVYYCYESTPVWVPELKQSRPIRKYLGRYDPETGEIIPTKGRRKSADTDPPPPSDETTLERLYRQSQDDLKLSKEKNKELQTEIKSLTKEVDRLSADLARFREATATFLGQTRGIR